MGSRRQDRTGPFFCAARNATTPAADSPIIPARAVPSRPRLCYTNAAATAASSRSGIKDKLHAASRSRIRTTRGRGRSRLHPARNPGRHRHSRPAALRQLGGARVSVAKQSIERISSILDTYKLDVGSYPSTEQGLTALLQKPADAENWNGPYLKSDAAPLDPWNHPFIYRNPSERSGHDFDLCSAGPNNASGAPGQSGTICNP